MALLRRRSTSIGVVSFLPAANAEKPASGERAAILIKRIRMIPSGAFKIISAAIGISFGLKLGGDLTERGRPIPGGTVSTRVDARRDRAGCFSGHADRATGQERGDADQNTN